MPTRDAITFSYDVDPFRRYLANLQSGYRKAVEAEALEEVAEDALVIAADFTPFRSGKGKAGWKILDRQADRRKPFILIGNRVFYMRWLEFGTIHIPPFAMLTNAINHLVQKRALPKALRDSLVRVVRSMKRRQNF